MQIDLNADVGEGCGNDLALLDYVSSINIACGWHAGSALEMQQLVRAAIGRGVSIGAHPAYYDRENFGRVDRHLPLDEVRAGVLYQIGALDAIVRAEGGVLQHVKPHGALYNQAARDPALAQCLARAIRDFDPSLKVMGLAGSSFIAVLRSEGLHALEEGFADRGYARDGSLLPRGIDGAMISDDDKMLAQVLSMVADRQVIAVSGAWSR